MPRLRLRRSFWPILLLFLAPAFATAQVPGQVRADGREVLPSDNLATPDAGALPGEGLIDHREEMRRLIQAISTFARDHRRDFAIVPINGLELLLKTDLTDPDQERRVPAATYLRTIHGVLQRDVFFGHPNANDRNSKERRARLRERLKQAQDHGLSVLVMDHVTMPGTVSQLGQLSDSRGYAAFAAYARGLNLNRLPRIPGHPFAENGRSALSLRDVRNFLVIRDSGGFGRQDAFAMEVHGTNYDLVIVDVFHRLGEPLTKRAVETLKYKKLGAKRLVFAHVDIGTAAAYRYYWRPEWIGALPHWVSAPVPGEADRYFVEYWQPGWREILIGGTKSYIYGVIDQGYDGVLLDGIEAYRYFEGGLEAVQAGL